MKPTEVLIAILKEWPGSEDRRLRIARGARIDPMMLTTDRVNDYYRCWAVSLMGEDLPRLTDEELSIRFAVNERVLLAAETKTDEQNAKTLLLQTEQEMQRRREKAGT